MKDHWYSCSDDRGAPKDEMELSQEQQGFLLVHCTVVGFRRSE